MTTWARVGGCAGFNYTFLTQKERDNETGLDYFGARYYSSTQGRFTSTDIFGTRRHSPQSWNRYSYVLNNPLRYTDPLGLMAQDPKKCNDCINTFDNPVDLGAVNSKGTKSKLKRILHEIGSFFKGGSRTQSGEGEGGERDESEDAKEEERKADEKDLLERSPWRDPNAIPPVPINRDVIAPGIEDPSEAVDMEVGASMPQLNGSDSTEQLKDAVRRVASSEGSPEAKAELMTRFASQIRVRSQFQWENGTGRGTDGSYIIFGNAGYKSVHVVVISPQGTVYVGNYTGFTFSGSGVTPRYDVLKPVR